MREFIDIIQRRGLDEVSNFGEMPEFNIDEFRLKLMDGATKVKQIEKHIWLWRNGVWTILANDEDDQPLGCFKMSRVAILGTEYAHLDVIYVFPEHRRIGISRFLLIVMKSETDLPIIADGAVFAVGQKLLRRTLREPVLSVQMLNKTTGEIEPFHDVVDDLDRCYLLRETKLAYSVELSPGIQPIWIPYASDNWMKPNE